MADPPVPSSGSSKHKTSDKTLARLDVNRMGRAEISEELAAAPIRHASERAALRDRQAQTLLALHQKKKPDSRGTVEKFERS